MKLFLSLEPNEGVRRRRADSAERTRKTVAIADGEGWSQSRAVSLGSSDLSSACTCKKPAGPSLLLVLTEIYIYIYI